MAVSTQLQGAFIDLWSPTQVLLLPGHYVIPAGEVTRFYTCVSERGHTEAFTYRF